MCWDVRAPFFSGPMLVLGCFGERKLSSLQSGPLAVVSRVITLFIGVIAPLAHLFLAIYRGTIIPNLQRSARGPLCKEYKIPQQVPKPTSQFQKFHL